VRGTRRGIALNSAHTAVVDSYFADFKEVGADSQAICGWGGPGPFKIVNNYLEGAGENVMFGGADPAIHGLTPADIEIRRNHFSKPLTWKRGEPSFAGTPWTVKNLFELKHARRVLIDSNVFEHNWMHAQSGFAILFTVRNQSGTAPWSVVRDITVTNNLVRRSAGGLNILANDNLHPSETAAAILVRNNIFAEIGDPRWGPNAGVLFQLLRGATDVVIDHNTARATRAVIMAEGAPNSGFVFTNNVVEFGRYGVVGTGTGPGRDTLRVYFPGATFERNVLIGPGAVGNARLFPGGNFFVGALTDVGFVDAAAGDLRLNASSPFSRRDTRGGAIGADADILARSLNGVTQPVHETPVTSKRE
jgi:hypothetical protein